jgi:hypothetical protein
VGGGGTEKHQEDVVGNFDFFRGCQDVRVGDQHLKGVKESLERP